MTKISNLKISRWRTVIIFKMPFRHISAENHPISTKFSVQMQILVPITAAKYQNLVIIKQKTCSCPLSLPLHPLPSSPPIPFRPSIPNFPLPLPSPLGYRLGKISRSPLAKRSSFGRSLRSVQSVDKRRKVRKL